MHSVILELGALFFASILALVIIKFFITCIHNVYFHPLREYPGPKIAAATGLFFSYQILRGEEPAWQHSMHKKYGEIVRIAPDRLTFITPQAWKDISGYKTDGRLENRKDPATLPPNIEGHRSFGAEIVSEIHRPRRRIYAHAFSDRALKQQESLILGYANLLAKAIKEHIENDPSSALDLCKLFNCATFDIMADLTFGEPLGCLQQSEYTPWVSTLFLNIRNMSMMRMANEYKAFKYLIRILTPKSVVAAARQHYNHTAERVETRLKRGTDIGKPDIWKFVMERGEKIDLPKHLMKADAGVFMQAGTETTATLLSGLMYLLLKHPRYMERLKDEIRALNKEELTIEVLSHLPFMGACISEAFRIYPPSSIALFRKVPKGGNIICGRWIPEDTRIAVAQYAAYRSPLNFRDPDSFIPERWLPGSGYEDDRKDVLNPFSVGPRNCIGQNLAMHEMRIILATLLWNFEFELCPECENWLDQKVHLLWVKPPLLVKARYRGD